MVAAGDETQGQRETWLVGAGGVLHNSWAIWKTEHSSIHWIHSAGGKNLIGQHCLVLGSTAIAKELGALKSAPFKVAPPHLCPALFWFPKEMTWYARWMELRAIESDGKGRPIRQLRKVMRQAFCL